MAARWQQKVPKWKPHNSCPTRDETGVCSWCGLWCPQTRRDSNYAVGSISDSSPWQKNTLQACKTNLGLQVSESLSLWKGEKCVECSASTQLSEMSLGWGNCSASVLGKWCCANHLFCQRGSKDGEGDWTRQNLKDGKKQTQAISLKLQGIPEKFGSVTIISLLYLSPDFP